MLAKEFEYFRLGAISVSNDGSLLAYSTDTDGSERYRLSVKDLGTEEMLADEIEETTGNAVWSADGTSFFYTVVDANWRPWQVRRHVLGEPVEQDPVVYEETDPGFFVYVSDTASREYIVVNTGRHRNFGGAAHPSFPSPTQHPFSYLLVEPGTSIGWTIRETASSSARTTLTGISAWRLQLRTTRPKPPWEPLVDAIRFSTYIRDFAAFNDFIAVEERVDGLDQIRLIDRAGEVNIHLVPRAGVHGSSGH